MSFNEVVANGIIISVTDIFTCCIGIFVLVTNIIAKGLGLEQATVECWPVI